jgi:hypothetical protein
MSTQALAPTRAMIALRESPIPALRKLCVEETNDMVTILGKVSSYYFKQLAQETILPLVAGRELLNRVAVEREAAAVLV